MSNRLAKRIREAERRMQVGSVEVSLLDGRTIHVRQRDALDLVLAAFARADAANEGRPFAATQFDGPLNLLSKSEPVPSSEPLFALASDALMARPVLAAEVSESESQPQTPTVN